MSMEGQFRLEKKSGKYAFVDIDNEGVFIHGKQFSGALDGDTVTIKLIKNKKGSGKGAEGIVTGIVKRGKTKVIGRLQNVHGKPYAHVVPTDNLGTDIFISKPDGVVDGTLVLVDIVDYGNGSKCPNGKIIKVIGGYEDVDNMVDAIQEVAGVVSDFSDEVMEEVREIVKKADIELKEYDPNSSSRIDLRKLNFITVDDISSLDLDDGIWVKKNDNGSFHLMVAIADVSHYIPYGSKLDLEGRERGNSTYMIGRCIPELPKEISNQLCSLNEGVDKFTAIFDFKVDKKGNVIKSKFYKGVINTTHRMTYNVVNDIIADDDYDPKYNNIVHMINNLQELSLILRAKMKAKGNIDFNVEELKLKLDEHGKVEDISLRSRGEAERLIEMMMVLTNVATGKHLNKLKKKNVYRVHGSPDAKKLLNLKPILRKFDVDFDISDDTKKEYSSKDYQNIVEKIKGNAGETIINKMLLMSMKKAVYSTDAELGHYGLGLVSEQYSHVTSPIRRHSDITSHRVLFNPTNKDLIKEMDEICEHISETERASAKLEADSIKIKLAEYYKEQKLGTIEWGTISGLSKDKIYVKLENHVEVVMKTPEGYEFDRTKFEMKNKSGSEYCIGGEILVRINEVDMRDYDINVSVHYND